MYDVRIGNDSYINTLNFLPFSYEDMKEFVKNMSLTFPPLRNDAEKLPVPNFVKTFYEQVMSVGGLVTQKEFWEYYKTVHKDEIQTLIAGKNETELMKGIEARCKRAYPSLLRDIFLSLRLQHDGWDILWNPEVDVNHKTDMVVRNKNKLYGVALFTDTKDGNKWRATKLSTRTSMPKEFIKVELSIKMDEAERLGSFKAYGPKQIKQLEDAIAESG